MRVVVEDTNHIVHKMRRSARWSLIFSILWWLSIIGLTGALYYYYLAPYIEGIKEIYGNAQGWEDQVAEFFRNFRSNQ